jgi:hypothetical protein
MTTLTFEMHSLGMPDNHGFVIVGLARMLKGR